MSKQELPKSVELKQKVIICPKCQTKIEIDLTIDISSVTDIIGMFQGMGKKGEGDD